jgi:hypothetical protein
MARALEDGRWLATRDFRMSDFQSTGVSLLKAYQLSATMMMMII